MKQYHGRKRTGRKKSIRLLSVMLCFCLLITACPYMPGAALVHAAGGQENGRDAVIQALLDRIAALPDSEEYLAKEPDAEAKEAYAEWMEGLHQYAGEALDIQEAYEALTGKQQAQIPAEAQDKLVAWVQTAMQIAGNDRVMLAAVEPTPGVISSDQVWSGGSLSAGTYTIKPGVTVTVTDTLLIEGNVNVTIKGGGTLKRDFTTGSENGSIIKVDYGGGLILDNVIIDGDNDNKPAQGPAVYIGDGTVTMQNGSIIQNNYNANTGNNGDQAGGGIYCEGTLQIDGGTIKNCSTYDDQMTSGRTYAHAGGAIYLKGDCTMTSGSITGNTANNGGGIYLASKGARLELSGGTIAGNSVRSGGNGAGIYYSTLNGATSTLVIGGNANVQDVIYLDITSGTLYPYIKSSLRHKITLACSEGDEGRVLLGGEGGYTLTIEDARMVSMQNTSLYSRLDSGQNRIYLSKLPCGHENIQKVSAKEATCLAAGNKEYYICTACVNLFSDSAGKIPTTLEAVTIAQKSHNYTYNANGAVITEKCGNGCGHSVNATLTLSSTSLTYTGQPLKPASIEYTGDTWVGTAPTIGYENNTNVGNATASITVNGKTASLGFTITPAEMSGVSASGYTGTYDGTAHGITVNAPAGATVEYGTSAGSYTKNTSPTYQKVGDYTVYYQVTMTNYITKTGSAQVKISAKSLTDSMITLASGPHYYNGLGITPVVTVKDGSTGLISGTDYTVSYSNNKNVGTATVTVTGKGNYTGTLSETFTIEYRQLPSGSLTDYITISPKPTNGWYGSDITLTPKSGCEVGETSAGIGAGAVTISQETGTDGSTKTIYIKDGGNIYQTEFSYKLDKTPPAVDLTNMAVENGTKNLWDWIIGKKSMMIKIPAAGITETLSGVAEVSYTAESGNGTAQTETIHAQDGYYEIALNAEFSGTIKLTVKDKAGNTTQTSLTADSGKVIAENYAPVVTFALPDTSNADGWYNTAFTITVAVTDNKDSGNADILSGGIAEISWKDGESGTVQTVSGLPGNAPAYEKEFTISVNTDGTHTYYVNVVDNAGNESGWQTATVKVDTGNPVFSGNVTVTNPTEEGADIVFIPSEGGKAYWIVSDIGTAPTAQEVKEQSGQKGGVQNVTGGSSSTFTIKGLTPGEKHTVYVVLEDAAGNLSEVKKGSFFTMLVLQEEKPDIRIDYRKETLTGFTPGEKYKITVKENTVTITATTDGTLKLEEEWLGTTVSIVKCGNGKDKLDSDALSLTVPARSAQAPSPSAVGESRLGAADGKLTGLEADKNYQISTDSGATWTDTAADKNGEITKLAPGSYIVRVSGTDSAFAGSPSGRVTITAGQGTRPETEHKYPEQWTVEKEATEKEPGREYKICETCGTKIYRTIDPSGASADPYAGKIEKEVEVLPGAPDTVLNNSREELAKSILTPEEIAEVGNGTDAKIWLEIAPDADISEKEKAQVQKAAEKSVGDGAEVTYFDASLFKQVGNGEKTEIHEPGIPISVTIVIPEDIRNKNMLMVRNYQIIRLHGGRTDIIEGTYKEDSAEFTFETDKFSTYAICYKDVPKQAEPAPTPGGTAEPGTPTSAPGESDQPGNEIEKRKDLSILLATGKQKGSTGIKLTWSKWKGASGYEVYWSYCDGKKNYKKLKTVKAKAKRTYTHKKRKKNRAYKYYIAAYKKVNGKKKYVAKTPVIHVAMKYEKRTNAKKITLNKTKLVLSLTNKKYKKKFKIRAKAKKENSKKKFLTHAAQLRYYTDDKKVAKVSKTGKITARGRGKCTVYVIAINGVCKKIKVTVK